MKTTDESTLPILVNYRDLETYIGLKRSTISKKIMRGEFTNIVKIGRKNYFKTKDVLAWIESQTIEVL
jgi:predicted DNA-binding transcriptional regulator AlpA